MVKPAELIRSLKVSGRQGVQTMSRLNTTSDPNLSSDPKRKSRPSRVQKHVTAGIHTSR